jgi:cobalt-zinc-cadmium efflux system outer membrane protein
MDRKQRRNIFYSTAWLMIAGCATVHPRPDYDRAAARITGATGQAEVYQPGDEEACAARVDELLEGGITADEAVQICLLNNPSLQAAFMDIGVARADLVQAGLLSNPSLSAAVRLPSGGGLANVNAGLAQNIADLWQIPPRKRAAERLLDRTILDLARRAASLAAEAKAAYFQAVGAQERHAIGQQNLGVAKTLLDLAQARQQAGAATELDTNLSRSSVLQAELAVESDRLAAADRRRTLATLLGLTSNADSLVLLDPLPEVPTTLPDVEHLVEVAMSSRLDLRAAEQTVAAAEAELLKQYRRVFPRVDVGLELERGERKAQGGRDVLADTARASIANGGLTAPEIQPRSARRRHTDLIIGPSLNLELPFFDQNQAQIAKARFAYEQADKTLEALERSVSQEVRGAVDKLQTAWKVAQVYRDRSIPLAQSNLDLSRDAYQAGRASFLTVLEAQRVFLDSRARYIDAAQTAASAIPELERTVGLPFRELVSTVPTGPSQDSADNQLLERSPQ